MTADTATTIRELDSRSVDGIQVRLMWCELECKVSVSVTDIKNGEAFSLPVRDGDRALDVFHYPYAYAAYHGIEPVTAIPLAA
jgi:hypothetical protein